MEGLQRDDYGDGLRARLASTEAKLEYEQKVNAMLRDRLQSSRRASSSSGGRCEDGLMVRCGGAFESQREGGPLCDEDLGAGLMDWRKEIKGLRKELMLKEEELRQERFRLRWLSRKSLECQSVVRVAELEREVLCKSLEVELLQHQALTGRVIDNQERADVIEQTKHNMQAIMECTNNRIDGLIRTVQQQLQYMGGEQLLLGDGLGLTASEEGTNHKPTARQTIEEALPHGLASHIPLGGCPRQSLSPLASPTTCMTPMLLQQSGLSLLRTSPPSFKHPGAEGQFSPIPLKMPITAMPLSTDTVVNNNDHDDTGVCQAASRCVQDVVLAHRDVPQKVPSAAQSPIRKHALTSELTSPSCKVLGLILGNLEQMHARFFAVAGSLRSRLAKVGESPQPTDILTICDKWMEELSIVQQDWVSCVAESGLGLRSLSSAERALRKVQCEVMSSLDTEKRHLTRFEGGMMSSGPEADALSGDGLEASLGSQFPLPVFVQDPCLGSDGGKSWTSSHYVPSMSGSPSGTEATLSADLLLPNGSEVRGSRILPVAEVNHINGIPYEKGTNPHVCTMKGASGTLDDIAGLQRCHRKDEEWVAGNEVSYSTKSEDEKVTPENHSNAGPVSSPDEEEARPRLSRVHTRISASSRGLFGEAHTSAISQSMQRDMQYGHGDGHAAAEDRGILVKVSQPEESESPAVTVSSTTEDGYGDHATGSVNRDRMMWGPALEDQAPHLDNHTGVSMLGAMFTPNRQQTSPKTPKARSLERDLLDVVRGDHPGPHISPESEESSSSYSSMGLGMYPDMTTRVGFEQRQEPKSPEQLSGTPGRIPSVLALSPQGPALPASVNPLYEGEGDTTPSDTGNSQEVLLRYIRELEEANAQLQGDLDSSKLDMIELGGQVQELLGRQQVLEDIVKDRNQQLSRLSAADTEVLEKLEQVTRDLARERQRVCDLEDRLAGAERDYSEEKDLHHMLKAVEEEPTTAPLEIVKSMEVVHELYGATGAPSEVVKDPEGDKPSVTTDANGSFMAAADPVLLQARASDPHDSGWLATEAHPLPGHEVSTVDAAEGLESSTWLGDHRASKRKICEPAGSNSGSADCGAGAQSLNCHDDDGSAAAGEPLDSSASQLADGDSLTAWQGDQDHIKKAKGENCPACDRGVVDMTPLEYSRKREVVENNLLLAGKGVEDASSPDGDDCLSPFTGDGDEGGSVYDSCDEPSPSRTGENPSKQVLSAELCQIRQEADGVAHLKLLDEPADKDLESHVEGAHYCDPSQCHKEADQEGAAVEGPVPLHHHVPGPGRWGSACGELVEVAKALPTAETMNDVQEEECHSSHADGCALSPGGGSSTCIVQGVGYQPVVSVAAPMPERGHTFKRIPEGAAGLVGDQDAECPDFGKSFGGQVDAEGMWSYLPPSQPQTNLMPTSGSEPEGRYYLATCPSPVCAADVSTQAPSPEADGCHIAWDEFIAMKQQVAEMEHLLCTYKQALQQEREAHSWAVQEGKRLRWKLEGRVAWGQQARPPPSISETPKRGFTPVPRPIQYRGGYT